MKTTNFAASKNRILFKNLVFFLTFGIILSSCSADDEIRSNPYLTDISFRINLNLSLPEYNALNFPGNNYVTYNEGINGIVIYNINNNQYAAFELSDPNHALQSCSKLSVDGLIASCNCNDGNSYNILTGELSEGTGQYSLKPYRLRKSGNTLEIYN